MVNTDSILVLNYYAGIKMTLKKNFLCEPGWQFACFGYRPGGVMAVTDLELGLL
jgi:hypothetical protein